MRKIIARVRTRLGPITKAVVAAAWGAIAPLLAVGFTNGFDWKAIAAAAGGSAVTAISVYLARNTQPVRPGS